MMIYLEFAFRDAPHFFGCLILLLVVLLIPAILIESVARIIKGR